MRKLQLGYEKFNLAFFVAELHYPVSVLVSEEAVLVVLFEGIVQPGLAYGNHIRQLDALLDYRKPVPPRGDNLRWTNTNRMVDSLGCLQSGVLLFKIMQTVVYADYTSHPRKLGLLDNFELADCVIINQAYVGMGIKKLHRLHPFTKKQTPEGQDFGKYKVPPKTFVLRGTHLRDKY